MIYKAVDKWNAPYLEHKNGFKYIAKKLVNGTYRYFYTNEELQAFLNGGVSILKDTSKKAKKALQDKQISLENPNNKIKVTAKQKKQHLDVQKNRAKRKISLVWTPNGFITEHKDRMNKLDEKVENDKKRRSRILSEKAVLVDKNGQDGDHKYLYKVKINGNYRYFYSEDEYQAYMDRSEYLKDEPDFMMDVPRSNIDYTRDEDMIQVNPKYGEAEDYEVNCAECSVIYELRRRGYDVESNGIDGYDYNGKYNGDDRWNLLAENAKTQVINTYDDLTEDDFNSFSGAASDTYVKKYTEKVNKEFDKMPNGSRGEFSCWWIGGGGHSMVWEKDSNGKVTIYDSQVSGRGKTYVHKIEDIARYSFDPDITRTDNITFKPAVKDIFKNRSTNLSENKTETYYDYEVPSSKRH